MSDFAKKFKKLREKRGMSLYEVAKVTGLSKQGVINLEKEGSDPQLSTIVKIAAALPCGTWELMPDAAHRPLEPGDLRDLEAVRKAAQGAWDNLKPTFKALEGLLRCDRSTFAPSSIS